MGTEALREKYNRSSTVFSVGHHQGLCCLAFTRGGNASIPQPRALTFKVEVTFSRMVHKD